MSVDVRAVPSPALTRPLTRPLTGTTPTVDAIGPVTEHAGLDRLVGRAVAGDPRARQRLIAEIHPLIVRYCRGRLDRRDTSVGSADDLAQDICRAVVTALPGYTANGRSFYAYVYGIAAQRVTDAVHGIGRNRAALRPQRHAGSIPLDRPGQRQVAGEPTEQLRELLYLLDPADREVIVLRVLVGLSAEQTAQALCCTPGAVRVAQHGALNRLRDLISLRPPRHTAPDPTPASGPTVVAVIPGQRGRSAHASGVAYRDRAPLPAPGLGIAAPAAQAPSDSPA